MDGRDSVCILHGRFQFRVVLIKPGIQGPILSDDGIMHFGGLVRIRQRENFQDIRRPAFDGLGIFRLDLIRYLI